MPAPTVEDVRNVIETSASDVAVQAFIDDAALLVEKCVVGFSDARTSAVVRWVAAHLIASAGLDDGASSGAMTSRKLGDASETYSRGALGQGLSGTSYGLAAIALDGRGCLINLHKQAAKFEVL